jgi:hypothetical protein
MPFVNVGTVITKARTKLTGAIPRATLAVWFNEVVRDILGQPRTWAFLSEPVTLAIVNNQITIPAGVSEIVTIQVGSQIFTKGDQLSPAEALKLDMVMTDSTPVGYTMSADNVVTFHPGATGDAILTGETDVTTDYADAADTIFPLVFENLFIAGVLEKAFYTDKDGRFTAENTKFQMEMSKVKKWDNLRKPAAHFDYRGLARA